MSEFKYLECILDESGTDEARCHKKVARMRRVAGTFRFLVNARGLQLEPLLLSALMLHCKTMI